MEGRLTIGLPLLACRGLTPWSRCFSRLEAAELEVEAVPELVETLDLDLAGDCPEASLDCEELIIWSTLG